MSDPTGWLAAKPNAPLSTAGALSAIAVAPAFLLFINEPVLFAQLDFAKLLLVSIALGLPILSLSAGLCIAVLHGIKERTQPLPTPASLPAFVLDTAREPRYEWEGIWLGAGLANLIFYGLAAWAHFCRFSTGRTLLLVVLILICACALAILVTIAISFRHRQDIRG